MSKLTNPPHIRGVFAFILGVWTGRKFIPFVMHVVYIGAIILTIVAKHLWACH